MTLLLLSTLIMLTPVSGVVSGGRLTSFAMKFGLIPSTQWMYVPGLPACSTGTFTELTFQGGYHRSFRVISSGETAGLEPMIASRVTEDGYAAQMLVGDLSFYCISNLETGSYASTYKNLTLDFRGSSLENIHSAVEYSDDYILLSATENTSAFGVSVPLGDGVAIGPAYCKNRFGGDFWLQTEVKFGPLTVVSAPAIDEQNTYRKLYGIADYNGSQLLYGWDGISSYGLFSVQREGLAAAVSFPVPGVIVRYTPSENLILLASHREEGWFQGEIQGNYRGITAGLELLRGPADSIRVGFSAGISMGSRGISRIFSFDSPWFSQMAVASPLY